ncbi:MAG TPA: porin [Burkholderiaceae bacterium]
MKKKALGVGLLLAAHGAMAQTAGTPSVELYGILDVALVNVEHQLNADGAFPATVNTYSPTKSATVTHSVNAMINGGMSDSRWGLRGTEELGGGLKAFFTLESGFNMQDGQLNNCAQGMANGANTTLNNSANCSLNGQLFSRQAFVGLSDANLGKLSFGRNYNPMFDIAVAYDPVMASQAFSPLGFASSIGGGGGVAEDTRVDNSLRYSNKIGDVNFGALYKVGGQAGSASAQSAYVLNLGYEAGAFGIQGAYSHFNDAMIGSQSATPGAVNVSVQNAVDYFIAAKYSFGNATIKGGWERYSLQAASDYSTAASLAGQYYNFPLGSVTSYGWTAGVPNGAPDKTTNVYFIGGDYNFTPALNLAAGYYAIVNSAVGANALGAGATASSNIDALSFLLDYHFSKRTETYAGLMAMSYGGIFNTPAFNTSNRIFGIGMRHKF